MAILIVTDNYYFMQGLRHLSDDFCYIDCAGGFDREIAREQCLTLTSEDYVIIHFSHLEDLLCFYRYFLFNSPAKVVVAPDAKFVSDVSDINDIYFLSANASVKAVENMFKLKKYKIRKRSLTPREEKVMSLMIIGNLINDISRLLGLSIKTISLHKTNTSNKVGLLNNNNITMLALMRFILPASENEMQLI